MEWFDEIKAAQLEEYRTTNGGMAKRIEQLGGLYLFGTIGLEAVLMADGSVVIYDFDDWTESGYSASRVATEGERVAALVIASERMPILASMLPTRPDVAHDCEFCGGTGKWPPPAQGALCPKCNGLGWATG